MKCNTCGYTINGTLLDNCFCETKKDAKASSIVSDKLLKSISFEDKEPSYVNTPAAIERKIDVPFVVRDPRFIMFNAPFEVDLLPLEIKNFPDAIKIELPSGRGIVIGTNNVKSSDIIRCMNPYDLYNACLIVEYHTSNNKFYVKKNSLTNFCYGYLDSLDSIMEEIIKNEEYFLENQ